MRPPTIQNQPTMSEAEAQQATILTLTSQLSSLQRRIKELEADNSRLSSRLSSCRCHETEEKLNGLALASKFPSRDTRRITVSSDTITQKPKSLDDTSVVNHCARRHVALKVMYFGKRFYGFASEAQMEPTIESEIFKALKKTTLLIGDKKEAQYSRCGRTDKGVSSVGQVIALFLRSKFKEIEASKNSSRDVVPEMQIEGEIDYPKVLNRVLPNDIRIVGWSPVPNDFNARFSCLSREYKYLFWSDNLNISVMESAGKKFVGEHNFSNFCKMDAANVHNYRRRITSFKIFPCHMRFEDNHQLGVITIKGSAFLWHQVRCMVAVLFMIGQGLESPDVIDALLDTESIPRKPQYPMAPEIPLVLHSCEFEGLKFICSSDAQQALQAHLENECQNYQLQAAICHEALLSSLSLPNDHSPLDNMVPKKKASHVPLMSRPTEPSYKERRAKLESMKLRDC